MDITSPVLRRAPLALVLLVAALACAAGPARAADLPDPMARGKHPVTTMSVGSTPGAPGDTSEAKLGLVALQEPNGSGSAPSGTSAAASLQVRGSLYYPTDAKNAPLIFLVHGNHTSCRGGSAPNCSTFNRNDAGYAYLAENLASWGYVVFSLDQDQMMYYQDSSYGKGMHQRRMLISAALDGLYAANQPGGLPDTPDTNVKDSLVGKIDFNRIGMMGHSRGGDAVSNFLAYNRERPAPGRRYKIRAVIALAPVDYERSVPQGVAYLMEAGACDGDVSNTQGTRMFARSLYADPTDPFPRIQMMLHGANHNWFNSEWTADNDDATTADPACGPNTAGNIRLSKGNYSWTDPLNFFSGDPALMGDQPKAGLATMAAFFRRYVGGEMGFDPWMTGETMYDGKTPAMAKSACPAGTIDNPDMAATAMPCFDRLSTTYFAAPAEREDVIQPDAENPLTVSALGTSLVGSGFADPYANSAGTVAQPATAQGFDWCNPEPNQFTPSQLGISGLPTAKKPCPLPAATALGGQSNGARENAPVNGSYQPQLTLAWEQPATLSTRIPAADGDVSGFKALALDTSVNYWDPRNPARSTTLPETGMQNFTVTLTDAAGRTATVAVGDKKYGLGLQQSIANITTRMHVILRENRIPIADFTAQGLDATQVRSIAFGFGGAGMPASGSIQLANVRFQEAVGGTKVFADTAGASGPATNPVAIRASNAPVVAALKATKRAKAAGRDVVWVDGIKR
jgi:hypothetical protein